MNPAVSGDLYRIEDGSWEFRWRLQNEYRVSLDLCYLQQEFVHAEALRLAVCRFHFTAHSRGAHMPLLRNILSWFRGKVYAVLGGERPSHSDLRKAKYWAFVSYNRQDRRIARWCREELGKQRVPRQMRSPIEGSPRYLSPIFLDENAASASPTINAEFRIALDNSRYLIVVCSPFAVASSYVCDEIRYFQAMGRGDRILCLAASGIPNATDDGRPNLECFPEPLRVRTTASGRESIPLPERPLAAVLGDESKEEKKNALRQLAGGLLGISDSALRRIRLRRKAALGVAVFLVASATVFLLIAFVLPWRNYSRGYVRRSGTWQELDQFSHSDAMMSDQHFEFVRRGALGKPMSVRIADGFGNCPKEGMQDVLGQTFQNSCNTSRACEARFTYGQDGVVEKEELVDQYGTTLENLSYTNPSVGLFTQAGFGCSQSHSGATYVRFERDKFGHDHKVTFWSQDKDSSLEPAANNDGVYGLAMNRDPSGRLRQTTFLFRDGEPQDNREGFASSAMTYDGNGRVTGESFFSPTGEPVMTKDGYASIRRTLNDRKRLLREEYLDLNGHPVDSTDGYAEVRYRRGAHGETLSKVYLDADGHPTATRYGYASVHEDYDEHGYRIELRFFDTLGKPTTDSTKIAGMRSRFDPSGNPIYEEYFGIDGKPTFNNDAVAARQIEYDSRGNPIRTEFLGLNGEMVRSKDGRAIIQIGFDRHNEVADVKGFDVMDAPTLTESGYFEKLIVYDDNGNETSERYLGVDGSPTLNNVGISQVGLYYNSAGLEIEQRSFGLGGQPAITNDMGVASDEHYDYDSLGRVIKVSYFDGSGHPASDSRNISSMKYGYDIRSRLTDVAFFGTNGNPVSHANGAFAFHREYDGRGNLILEEYRDSTGALMLDRDGAAALKIERDRLGNMLSWRYLGVGLQPVLATAERIAGWNATFNEKGQQLKYELINLDGKLVADENGVARWTYKFDEHGDLIETQFLGVDGAPVIDSDGVGGWISNYDDRHREVEHRFIGAYGHAIASSKLLYASQRTKYDERGRVAEISNFGLNGQPVISNIGFSIERLQYDSRGNDVEYRFFDENGKPAHMKEAAKEVITRNTFGWEIERRFYDAFGRLMKNPTSGRAIVRFDYDSSGRIISERSLDEHDLPTDRSDLKYSKKTTAYDQTGKASSVCATTRGRILNPCPKE